MTVRLNSASVMKRFGIEAPSTLWRWWKSGKFPAPTVGPNGRNLWDLSAIEAFEAANLVQKSTITNGLGA